MTYEMTCNCCCGADLLQMLRKLEERIIQLEVELSKKRLVMDDDDSWYWDH